MGLSSDVYKALAEDKNCRQAIGVEYTVQPDTVYFTDVTGTPYTLRNNTGAAPTSAEEEARALMTMHQLRTAWFAHIRQPIDTLGVKYMVLMKDISRMVPIQKEREQKRRDEAAQGKGGKAISLTKLSKPKPVVYPEGTTITMEGVTEPGKPLNPVIDMRRIAITRGATKAQYWDLIFTFTSTYNEWPEGVVVIFDIKLEGPCFINTRGYNPFAPTTSWRYKVIHELQHFFGEGDLMMPYWLWLFRDQPNILIDTNDGDQLIIMLNYLNHVRGLHKHKQVILQRAKNTAYNNSKADAVVYVDLLKLYEAIGPARIAGFQALAIMSGTDFVEKKTVTPGIGAEYIFEYALREGANIRPFDLYPLLCNVKHVGYDDDEKEDLIPIWEPQMCHEGWMTSKRNHVPVTSISKEAMKVAREYVKAIQLKLYESYKKDKGRKAAMPELSKGTIQMIAFNIEYWNPHLRNIARLASQEIERITKAKEGAMV